PTEAEGAARHRWAPISIPAHGSLRLASDGFGASVTGRAYFDSNCSAHPLHRLGIRDWRWGRLSFPQRELIYYYVWPEDPTDASIELICQVGQDGLVDHTEGASFSVVRSRRALFGLDYAGELRLQGDGLDVEVQHRHLVDDGPFYLRRIVHARDHLTGESATGMVERVVPDRVDLKWQRFFVQMRRHRAVGDNSIWLPLFNGPRGGRWSRLVRNWAAPPPTELRA
ncbi:MAG: hypothetical protein AAGA56_07295, partial [Myxococcota bacterium]